MMDEFRFETTQKEQGEAEPSHVSPSPSFSSYSSETLAEIAARVIAELHQNAHSDDETNFQPWENDVVQQNDDVDENDDEFEFACVSRDPTASPVSADDIFYNGQIKPMYPIFDRTLLLNDALSNDAVASILQNANHETIRRRLPLRKLMFEEREPGSFSSSTSEESANVELEGVEEGTYCAWSPNAVGRERKKSNSTGSASKRWKLRDVLLLRSHSEGTKKNNKVVSAAKSGLAVEANGGALSERDGDAKKKSFLPYKQELVGLFTNVNGLGRNLQPF